MLTGLKDTDREILLKIRNERDFLSLCAVNKDIHNLCNEENIYYPDISKSKPPLKTWKQWYLKNMQAIGKLKEVYNFDYKTGIPVIYYNLFKESDDDGFREAGKFGYFDLIPAIKKFYAIENISSEVDRNIFEIFAPYMNSKDWNKLPINFANLDDLTYDTVFWEATINGNIEVFKKLENNSSMDIFQRAENVGKSGNRELIQYFLNKGFPEEEKKDNIIHIFYGLLENQVSEEPAMVQSSYDNDLLVEEFYEKVKAYNPNSKIVFKILTKIVLNNPENYKFFQRVMKDFNLERNGRDIDFKYILYNAMRVGAVKIAKYLLRLGVEFKNEQGWDEYIKYDTENTRREFRELSEIF